MGDYEVGHMLELAKGDAFAIVALYERYPDECASEICYHAQQVVERTLKNAFVEDGHDFLNTHKLLLLLDDAVDKGMLDGYEELQDEAAFLSRFAGGGRYPQVIDVDKSVAMKAIADCKTFMCFLESNGYPTLDIPVEVVYLHDKVRPDKEVPERKHAAGSLEENEKAARSQAKAVGPDSQPRNKTR